MIAQKSICPFFNCWNAFSHLIILINFLWFRVFPESLIVVFLAPKHNSKLLMQTLKEEQYLRLMGVASLTIGGSLCSEREKGRYPQF